MKTYMFTAQGGGNAFPQVLIDLLDPEAKEVVLKVVPEIGRFNIDFFWLSSGPYGEWELLYRNLSLTGKTPWGVSFTFNAAAPASEYKRLKNIPNGVVLRETTVESRNRDWSSGRI